MISMKRVLGTGAAALALLTGGVAMAPVASAASPQQACSTIDIGSLCLTRSDAGYDARFHNRSASVKRLDFRLYCHSSVTLIKRPGTLMVPSRGNFISTPNRVNTFHFDRRSVPTGYVCALGLMNVVSGKEYLTRGI